MSTKILSAFRSTYPLFRLFHHYPKAPITHNPTWVPVPKWRLLRGEVRNPVNPKTPRRRSTQAHVTLPESLLISSPKSYPTNALLETFYPSRDAVNISATHSFNHLLRSSGNRLVQDVSLPLFPILYLTLPRPPMRRFCSMEENVRCVYRFFLLISGCFVKGGVCNVVWFYRSARRKLRNRTSRIQFDFDYAKRCEYNFRIAPLFYNWSQL